MTPEERQLVNGLFERIGNAADSPRDKEAEAFINDQVRQRPYAPYLLAQTVIIQEEALKAASSRIEELEGQLRDQNASQGGFLGGLGKTIFGGEQRAEPRPATVPRTGNPWGAPPPQQMQPGPSAGPASGPWGAPQAGAMGGGFGGGGGGFLRGAMTTAAGVAGGALLYQGISSLFGGQHGSGLLSEAQGLTGQASGLGNELFGDHSVLGGAQPASAPEPDSEPAYEDPGIEDAGYDDSDDIGDDSGGDDWV